MSIGLVSKARKQMKSARLREDIRSREENRQGWTRIKIQKTEEELV